MADEYFDLHTYTSRNIGENSAAEMLEFAKSLGLSGVGIVRFPEQEALRAEGPASAVDVVLVKAANAAEMDAIVEKVRGKAEIVAVSGGDYDTNRAACLNPKVDILLHPEQGRHDSGLDHICARAAQENEVAIELNLHEILESFKRNRVRVLTHMRRNILLCSKYGAKMIVTSGARSKWELRTGRELASIAAVLGIELGKAIEAVSVVPSEMIAKNRAKLSGALWEGVRVVPKEEGG